ncbi:hypothetical protein SLA2020_347800 [Shorea laevis]
MQLVPAAWEDLGETVLSLTEGNKPVLVSKWIGNKTVLSYDIILSSHAAGTSCILIFQFSDFTISCFEQLSTLMVSKDSLRNREKRMATSFPSLFSTSSKHCNANFFQNSVSKFTLSEVILKNKVRPRPLLEAEVMMLTGVLLGFLRLGR